MVCLFYYEVYGVWQWWLQQVFFIIAIYCLQFMEEMHLQSLGGEALKI
jgi:hypothetical protein